MNLMKILQNKIYFLNYFTVVRYQFNKSIKTNVIVEERKKEWVSWWVWDMFKMAKTRLVLMHE